MARLGRLRYRVQIERKQPGLGSRGQASGKWRTVATTFAAIRQVSERESLVANQQRSVATHAIDIRSSSKWEPTAKDRVRHGAKIYQIGSVVTDERARWITLLVTEITS